MIPHDLHVSAHHLCPGDVLPGRFARRYAIVTIQREGENYAVVGTYTDTSEPMTSTIYPGPGYERVVGGPKFDALAGNAALAWKNPNGKYIWKGDKNHA